LIKYTIPSTCELFVLKKSWRCRNFGLHYNVFVTGPTDTWNDFRKPEEFV